MTTFLFDLDGTLANTIPLIRLAARQTVESYNVNATDEQLDSFIGIPLVVHGELILGEGRGTEYADAYSANYLAIKNQVQPYDGIVEMIKELAASGNKLAVVTSKRREPAHETIAMIGLKDYFPVVLHCESGAGYKPDPDPAQQALLELDSEASGSWFIGDSIHDIACAHAAGMGGIAVTWGATPKAAFAEVSPEYICDSVEQLAALLRKLSQN